MKTILHTIKASFGSRSFYKERADTTATKGLIFILQSSVMIGCILGLIGIVFILIFKSPVQRKILSVADTLYPTDLIVTIKDGTLTTNSTEPTIIPVPPQWQSEKGWIENLVVIAPEESADPSILSTYSTYIALTKEYIIAGEQTDQIRTYPYKGWNGVVTKENFITGLTQGLHIGTIILIIGMLPLMIVLVLIRALFHMIWLFVVALIVLLINKLQKVPYSYKQIYRMGLYTIIPLILLEIIAIPLGITGKLFSLIVMGGIVLYTSRDMEKEIVTTQ